jgi:crotonobetainyl-CoA:carnitine CoA-transferase CaiB-like acyl-CoA transferase
MPGPLEGLRVVELGVWVAGPAAAGILSDWGADVIKIEPPTGDPARTFQRMLGGDLPSNPPFELDNRSKRSIVIDLTVPDGHALALELIEGADVFLTNIRPSALSRLGLDYDTLHARFPSLVYTLITGYGLDGPDRDRPAYDIAAFWARSGLAALLTLPGGDPPFQRGGMGDHSVGMTAAGATMAALYARQSSGEGQLVSTSLFRQGVYTVGFDINISLLWGLTLRVGARTSIVNPSTNNYTAGDGRRFWIVGLEADRHWPPLAHAVGHPEWLEDERFATAKARAAHAPELTAELDAIFATKPLAEWADLFAVTGEIFWSPLNTVEELLADPQLRPSGALVEVPDGSAQTTMVATPADFSSTPWEARFVAPELGEHTRGVLAELGRSPEEIAALEEAGVIGSSP